jgi:hypothetical protein
MEPAFVPELCLVELVYSDDRQARVAITRDKQGLYRLHPERWDLSELSTLGRGYWGPWGDTSSITDDLDVARRMANEFVRA